jgi:hypothetical protein
MENSMSGTKPGNLHHQSKRTGSFYTPEYLTRLITEDAMTAWLSQVSGKHEEALESLRRISVLDPASGDGAFLLSAAEWLLETRLTLGDSLSIPVIRQDIVENCIFGVDVVDTAAEECRSNLVNWAAGQDTSRSIRTNVVVGNSLIGETWNTSALSDEGGISSQFSWMAKFPGQMKKVNPGFDVILGNPPYGNILSQAERNYIRSQYPFDVFSGRKGTWNIASQFIVRCQSLIRKGGQVALLIPNSILRVGQFSRTREFLLNNWRLWQIADEGNPFDDVTLEMVTVFACAKTPTYDQKVNIISRRPDVHSPESLRRTKLAQGRFFVLYQDAIFNMIRERGSPNILGASRGRDIPHDHVKKESSQTFTVPYATKGRSINRYRFCDDHLRFADDWFKSDDGLFDSYSNEFLVATKNLPYPRAVMKPKGVIHGGGAVRIWINNEDVSKEAIGLILNSRLVRYYCTRYLTNESRLTTCLNTGIVDEIPILTPEEPNLFSKLFSYLQTLYQTGCQSKKKVTNLESLADALVYDLYLGETVLHQLLEKTDLEAEEFDSDVSESIQHVMSLPIVQTIESYPRLQ